MAPAAPALYLVDGHAQLYRAYHAHLRENRRATDGTPTGAVYGFFLQLRSIRSRFKPELLGCVFDPPGLTFREKKYAAYKAQRAPMPDDLKQQVPLALELCRAYGIPPVQAEGYEADDVLATLAQQARARGLAVVIVSSDKDLLQLVQPGITVYDPMKEIHYDADKVSEVRGLKPEQVADWLGLMGDATDNIPGVTGVGEQTALKLLQEHGSLDKVLEHYQAKLKDRAKEIREFVAAHEAQAQKAKEAGAPGAKVKPPKGLKVVEAYLFAQADQARASRELARLRTDAPVKFDPEPFTCGQPDRAALAPLLARLDLRQFLREIGGAEEGLLTAAEAKGRAAAEQSRHHLVDTAENLRSFARELSGRKALAINIETTRQHPLDAELLGLSFAWKPGEAWYLPLRGLGGDGVLPKETAIDACRKALEDPGVAKTGQDLKSAMHVLRGCGVELKGLAFDAMIAGWLLDPGALRHDLDALVYDHLKIRRTGAPGPAGKGKAPGLDLTPAADLMRSACEDADLIWQLADAMRPKLTEAGLAKLMDEVEMPLVEVLAEMEAAGVRVDAALLKDMSRQLGDQLAAIEEDIYKLAGERFTINSPRQLAQILFQKLKLESLDTTAGGQPSTGEEVLKRLSRQHELPGQILEYRQLAKLKNTYLDALPELIRPDTGRIHATFRQTGTETGRLSSSDPNLQNIPVRAEQGRHIRAAFKPGREEWRILSADYSQIELRVLAHYSQDPALLAAFKRNEDIHAAVASRIFETPRAKVTRDQRAQAKTVNFGVLYGQTPYGLSQTLGVPQREAQEIIQRFFEGFPNVRQCLDAIIAEAREKGCVTTILGRRRFVPQLKEKSQEKLGERIAVNTVFQGSAADLIKKAMVGIHRKLRAPGSDWKARMILQIHDELLFECPSGEVRELTALAKKQMEQALPLRVPLVVDVGVGSDWLSAKE